MTGPIRRDLLLSLLALNFAPATGRAAPPTPLPPELLPGLRMLRAAYIAHNPAFADPAALARDLLPNGWSAAAEVRLRRRAAADFRAGRLFVFRGWRLSDTEARLSALLGG